MTDNTQYYTEKQNEYKEIISKLKKLSRILSLTRLGVFISYAICIYFCLVARNMQAVITISIIFPTAFITLFVFYEKNKKKLNYYNNLNKICQDETKALQGDFSAFDPGEEYISSKHYFSYDLDIFGHNSIFSSLNRTSTLYGKNTLADYLLKPNTNTTNIIDFQESIKELSLNPDFLMHFRAKGMETNDKTEDKDNILNWINSEDIIYSSKWKKAVRFIIPTINIALITICSLGIIPFSIVLLSSISLFLISGYNIKKINSFHMSIGKKNKSLQKYYKLLHIIEDTQTKSKILKEIKEDTSHNKSVSHKELKQLSFLIGTLDNRLNLMLGSILNIVFLHDFHVIYSMEKWKHKNKDNITRWFNAIGKMDALCSMATYAFNNTNHTFPTPTEECILDATDMGHTLIPETNRVNNSIFINHIKEIFIITGPNMAGKSTFLRTVGINMILAMAGLPVCAKRFHFKPIKLYSSMRTTDSLDQNESYFHAELKRLSTLVEELKAGESYFVILDELLKGTNSQDKLNGSREFIKHILNYNSTGLIATHDLPLTDMEDTHPKNIKNKCFEIDIEGQNIYFNYKLKDGVTRNMNATILMKQMNIIQ